MKKLLATLSILVSISTLVSCNKTKIKKITLGQELKSMSGVQTDKYVQMKYDDIRDTITIESYNAKNQRVPITFNGVRLGSSVIDNANKVCDYLGFSRPEDSEMLTMKGSRLRRVDVENNYNYSADLHVPIYHYDFIPSTNASTEFPYKTKMISHYLNIKGNAVPADLELYVTQIVCKGTKNMHFNQNGEFDSQNFLENVLEKRLSEYISPANNYYAKPYEFLVADSKEIWKTINDLNWSNNRNYAEIAGDDTAIISRDLNYLNIAEKGALDICIMSGYSELLSYTLKFLNTSSVSSKVYTFEESLNYWTESDAPSKNKVKLDYPMEDKKAEYEVPSIYLDQVICI